MAGMATERIELEVGDRVVKISNPDRIYFWRAEKPNLILLGTTSRSATASSMPSTTGRACCTAFPMEWTVRRCIRSGCPRSAAVDRDGTRALSAFQSGCRRALRDASGGRDLGCADVHGGVPSMELPA